MYTYTRNTRRLDYNQFSVTELAASLREAYDHSTAREAPFGITVNGVDGVGIGEGWFRIPTMPPAREDVTYCHKEQGEGYRVITCNSQSPFISLRIPGVLYLLTRNAVAVNTHYSTHAGSIARAVFNIAPGFVSWHTIDANMEIPYNPLWGHNQNAAAWLVGRPPAAKPPAPTFDMEKVLISILGDKIATVIMKEIK